VKTLLPIQVNQQFRLVVALAALSWLGLFIHNAIELPALTVLSPENSLPALVTTLLVVSWLLLPWKRAAAVVLLGVALAHLVGGGIISVLPLSFLPFAPEQTLWHYLSHAFYALAQLPLIGVLIQQLRTSYASARTSAASGREEPARCL
jgi:hypothetical protein